MPRGLDAVIRALFYQDSCRQRGVRGKTRTLNEIPAFNVTSSTNSGRDVAVRHGISIA
jgi:hypothetical protein